MKLSDAIHLGSMLKPQTWLTLTEVDDEDQQCASCALGALCDAVGLLDLREDYDVMIPKLEAIFPGLNRPFHPTPYELARVTVDHKMPLSPYTLAGYISCLNDTGYYSREWVANWLVNSGNDIESVTPRVKVPFPVHAKESIHQ